MHQINGMPKALLINALLNQDLPIIVTPENVLVRYGCWLSKQCSVSNCQSSTCKLSFHYLGAQL